MKKHQRHTPGQAVVELALLSTLLFFVLAAAVDLGLIFFGYQSIANGALDGATYGSMRPADIPGIRARVRNESGTTNRNVVDMHDLNNDGVKFNDDSRIQVSYRANSTAASGTSCTTPNIEVCDVVVRIQYRYRPFFFLAPTLGLGAVEMSVSRNMTVRDQTFEQ